MKSKIFYGALAMLSLAACSQEEVLDVNRSGDEITFSVVTNKATRAADVYCNSHKPEGFKVWATYDNKTFIDGDNITSTDGGNTWTNTSGDRYWPDTKDNKTVDFYAEVNGSSEFDFKNGTATPTFNNFTVSTTLNEQKDLLYAVKLDQTKSKSPVALNFRHALSQIVFQAKNTNKNLHVTINSVAIQNVNSTGTFTFPTTSTDDKYGDHQSDKTADPADDVALNASGTWKVNTPANYAAESLAAEIVGDNTVVSLTNATETTTNDKQEDGSEIVGSRWKKNMLLLPQDITPWDPEEDKLSSKTTNTYFLIDCVIYNVVGDAVDKDNDVVLHNGPIAIPINDITWLQGKKYIYTFVFGEGNGGYDPTEPDDDDGDGEKEDDPVLTPITFEMTVDDFIPVTEEEIEMKTEG